MKTFLLAAIAVFVAVSAPAHAAFTTVLNPPGSEAYMTDILDNVYGVTFDNHHIQGTAVYTSTNGGITATRIDDYGVSGTLNLVSGTLGTGNDQIWTDGIASISAQAKFAGYSQEFGYDLGLGVGYEKAFDVSGNSHAVSGSGVYDFPDPSTWSWVRDGTGNQWSSDPSQNGGVDHMITYQITGLIDGATTTTWLLFWEDLPIGSSDRDFNDLVVEVKATTVVPAPGALLLGSMGMGIVGWLRRRRTL